MAKAIKRGPVFHTLQLIVNFFFASFLITFLSDGIATSINKQILSLFLIIMSRKFARTCLFVCTPWFHHTVMLSYQLSNVGVPVFCYFSSWFLTYWVMEMCTYLIMYSFLAWVGHPDIRWSVVSSYSLHRWHLLSVSCFKIFLLK
jgi:hypothetical protein